MIACCLLTTVHMEQAAPISKNHFAITGNKLTCMFDI